MLSSTSSARCMRVVGTDTLVISRSLAALLHAQVGRCQPRTGCPSLSTRSRRIRAVRLVASGQPALMPVSPVASEHIPTKDTSAAVACQRNNHGVLLSLRKQTEVERVRHRAGCRVVGWMWCPDDSGLTRAGAQGPNGGVEVPPPRRSSPSPESSGSRPAGCPPPRSVAIGSPSSGMSVAPTI